MLSRFLKDFSRAAAIVLHCKFGSLGDNAGTLLLFYQEQQVILELSLFHIVIFGI